MTVAPPHDPARVPPCPAFPAAPTTKPAASSIFPRMCDNIRLHAAGELGGDCHGNLGRGFRGRICGFLRVDYEYDEGRKS